MPVISVRVDKRTYEALSRLAREEGVSVYTYVKSLLERHINARVSAQVSGEVSAHESSQVSAQVSYQELERKLSELTSELTSRIASLEERVAKLERALSASTSKGHSDEPASEGRRARTRCVPKSSIRSLEAYVKRLEELGVLRDWWEEGDRYCFEVLEPTSP
jgi:hypothetical protein